MRYPVYMADSLMYSCTWRQRVFLDYSDLQYQQWLWLLQEVDKLMIIFYSPVSE